MLYDIEALKAAARAAIEADRDKWKTTQTLHQDQLSRETRDWVATWGPHWKAATARINRAIRDGKPITRDMLPEDSARAHGVAFFYPSNDARPATRAYRPPHDLANLLTVLGTLAGTTVNTSGLRELGISRDALRVCVQFMASGTIK